MAQKEVTAPSIVDTGIEGPVNGAIADASAFNIGFPDPGAGNGLPDLALPGETIRGNDVYGFTGDWDPTRPGDNNVRSQLDSGALHNTADGVITWGFLTQKHVTGVNNNPQLGEGKGYSPFSAAQMAAARIAIANWDDLIAPKFVEVAPQPGARMWAQGQADILLANTTTGPAQAWAYYPGYSNQYTRVAGDVWVASPSVNGSNAQLDPGFYGLQTLNHELGHAIGLSHPGDYNFGDDNDGDGDPDPITYEGDAFYFQDNHQYSIMSYFDTFEAGNNQVDWNLMRFVYPSTPMVDDIRVAQAKYGADMTTRTGDTTYGFHSTGDVTNAAMKFVNGEMLSIFTIWDAGGTDTLDLSGYRTGSVIDLREGAYSSAGGLGAYAAAPDPLTDPAAYLAFVNANNAANGLGARTAAYDLYFGGRAGANEGIPWFEIMGEDTLMENNIGIAYGAVIENAIGGAGNDQINGNQAANRFTGNGGADVFVIARYGADDTSVDTITDFQTGVDKIDLAAFGAGVNWSKVSVVGTVVQVDTDAVAGYDLTLNVLGSVPVQGDFVFG